MRIGRFFLPWIGALLVSTTIAHVAESALTSGEQSAVLTGCQAASMELPFVQQPTPRATSSDVMYVRVK